MTAATAIPMKAPSDPLPDDVAGADELGGGGADAAPDSTNDRLTPATVVAPQPASKPARTALGVLCSAVLNAVAAARLDGCCAAVGNVTFTSTCMPPPPAPSCRLL